MKNELVKNPQHNANGGFDCEVYHLQHGWIPFTASADDAEQHGRDVYALIESGEVGEIAPMPEPDYQGMFEQERQTRISEADSFASNPLKWSGLGDLEKTEFQSYYDALQAIEYGAEWPQKPAALAGE